MRDRPHSGGTSWPWTWLRSEGLEGLARLSVPAAVGAAGWSLAHFGGDFGTRLGATDGAETLYLTALATLVLAALAFLTPRPAVDLGVGSTLAVLAIWVLPPGPTRGVAMTLLLLGLVLVAASRRWSELSSVSPASALPVSATWAASSCTLIALQALMGAGELLEAGPDLASGFRFLGLPVLAAGALAVLAAVRGLRPACIAGALVGILGGGWGPVPTLALVALSGGAMFSAVDSRVSWSRAPLSQASLPQAPLPILHRIGWTRLAVRIAATVAILGPLLWQQRAGAVATASALVLALAPAGQNNPMSRRFLSVLPAVALLAGAGMWPLHSWSDATGTALTLPLLVPVAIFLLRRDLARSLAVAALALAAGLAAPEISALAAPAALAVLGLPRASAEAEPLAETELARPSLHGALQFQGFWSATLLAGTALAASYPWLRERPMEVALGRGGVLSLGSPVPALLAALAAILLLLLLSATSHLAIRRFGPGSSASPPLLLLAPGAILALLVVLHLPSTPRTVTHPGGRVLDRKAPELVVELNIDWAAQPADSRVVRSVVVDTHLAHAHDLAAGTAVALVRLEDRTGDWIEWPLRMGLETGEWAAGRPDVAERLAPATPEPWLSQVVEREDGPPFFGHRYRAVLDLRDVPPEGLVAVPKSPHRLTLRRAPGLPPQVTVAVFHVEVRP